MTFYFFFNVFCYLKIHVFFVLTLLPSSYPMILSSIDSSTRCETPHDAPPRTWTPPRRAASFSFQFSLLSSSAARLLCSPRHPPHRHGTAEFGCLVTGMCRCALGSLEPSPINLAPNDLLVQGCKPSNFIKFPAASDHSLLHLFYCITAGLGKEERTASIFLSFPARYFLAFHERLAACKLVLLAF